ncbi:negative regulator of the PHO system, putative [Entamoeba invadens IP1]|uniref:Negative regulator of the PHO system, putative n=1 Tax=Entamoeba invadens IP1 TaxID=370355 RepID=A0A0A1TV75_ENTIV|nr:negative regulator of the PHO system, putative [Entamoeba invadens IP1]ELP84196.1 negative regulator of the PHO system, putative [Entamoeba invadens IP1]|eukprot:XP_004183542.1 negative regulator of the PHO system, putative [Entamoeba invadens IP1]
MSITGNLFNLSLDDINYNIDTDLVGNGSFGAVYKATLKGLRVAIKIPHNDMNCEEVTSYLKEMEIMKESHSPNVVLFIGVVPSDTKPLFVTEFVSCNLNRFIHERDKLPNGYSKLPLDCYSKVDLFYQCCLGIQWLHNKLNIIHRDIKPSNFLIDEKEQVKVCDFGFAVKVTKKKGDMKCTPLYAAPEVLESKKAIGKESDIYSLAMTGYELFYEKEPFFEHNEIDNIDILLRELKNGIRPILPHRVLNTKNCPSDIVDMMKIHFEDLIDQIPSDADNIFNTAWDSDVKKRPDINKLVDTIRLLKMKSAKLDDSAVEFWNKNFLKNGRYVFSVYTEQFVEVILKLVKPKKCNTNVLIDNLGKSGEVDLKRFQFLILQFGNFYEDKKAFEKMEEVFEADWWFGKITMNDTLKQLKDQEDGVFLVRESNRLYDYPFTISLKENGNTIHIRLGAKREDKKNDVLYYFNLKTVVVKKNTIGEMLDELKKRKRITYACPREIVDTIY